MASAYYSNEERVIRRKAAVTPDEVVKTEHEDLEEVYEIERCLRHIKEKKCKQVALQFPDLLLVDAAAVALRLEKNCEAKIYILADTSYGHCDIDEVNASHVDADLIIHYGESALTPSAKIPTIFVFGKHSAGVDPGEVCKVFCDTFPEKENTRIVFLHHVSCHYIAASISDVLLPDYPYLSVGQLNIPDAPGGAGGQQEAKEEDNVLKDLCTKSCPGCPCRLEKEGKKKETDKAIPKKNIKSTDNGHKMADAGGPKMADATLGSNSSDVAISTLEVNTLKSVRDGEKTSSATLSSASNISDSTKSSADDSLIIPSNTENGTDGRTAGASGAVGVKRPPSTEKNESDAEAHKPDCKDYETGYYTIPLEVDKDLEDYNIFFLGPKACESLKNLMLTHPMCNVHVFDPSDGKCEKLQSKTNKVLMKRYYLVEKAKDAKIVGILAGTMGMAGYLECVNHMKRIGRAAGKKTYTFIVGKLTPEKLANFPEIDIFVLVANREHSIIDSSNFYRPVITPYEFEVACNPNREWTEHYVTDFRDILPGGSAFVEFSTDASKNKETTMSLITGKIRMNTEIEDSVAGVTSVEGASLAVRNEKTDLSVFDPNSAAHHLAEKSWKGLEQKLGETPVTKATKGRSGLPISYTNEIDF